MERGRSEGLRTHRLAAAIGAIAIGTAMPLASAQTAPTATLDRIRDAGQISLGYRTDARPFSYRDESGAAAGYSVALCQKVADGVSDELRLPGLKVQWIPVTAENRFRALQEGQIDLLCGGETATLGRRTEVAFSIPIFPGGIGALLRSDAPARLRELLAGRAQPFHPIWRAAATQLLQSRDFSVVTGTTAEKWLAERIGQLQILAGVVPVTSYDAGVRGLLDRRSDVFFGERAVLLDAARRHQAARDLLVVDRLFTYEPVALALDRGDEDFRLLVDRSLVKVYRSAELGDLYARWFGEPDESALAFFRWNVLPD